VTESPREPVDVAGVLAAQRAEVLVNLLPTGSIEASEFYARAALQAGCAFVNAIPTPLAQRADFQRLFAARRLPLFGDDIKSQLGTTILHRALLAMLELRGSTLMKTSQVNIGGNTDFANFVHRAETKLVSKRKSLARYLGSGELHVGHHYDPTRGPWKHALIGIEATVFGGSRVQLDVALRSDDKPNCAGSLVDLIRLARGGLDAGVGGLIPEACAFYMKSPPTEMSDRDAMEAIRGRWVTGDDPAEDIGAGALDTKLGR
jgi:myo-inositol-1-phosphate synthase